VRPPEPGPTAADIELATQPARHALDPTQAYFDAVLADRLVAIAESSLAQTESVLGQTRLARQVGNQSEFDLLRAQVTRDNQMPALLQRRTDRDLAHARLKQMLNVPGPDRLTLTTGLAAESDLLQASRQVVGAVPGGAQDDTISVGRAPVRQVAQALRAEQEQLRIAKSAWIPTVSLSTQYGRVAFPSSGLPDLGNFLTNWTVSLTASVPLFTGGRTRGQSMVAEAAVREAEARYEQVREAASLDAQHALALLNQAQAALAASQGTTEQAAKAYTIADVRYREGLSTQVELNDSRLLLQQASANAALAVRNLHVARMRVSLLRDLPLGVGAITIPLSVGGPALSPAPRQMAPQAGNAGASGGLVRTSAAAAVVPPLP
jgi:outer membrane protein TolC